MMEGAGSTGLLKTCMPGYVSVGRKTVKAVTQNKRSCEKDEVGRLLPYNFPSTRNVLWDHRSTGPSTFIHVAQYRNPIIVVEEKSLRLVQRFAQASNQDVYNCFLVASCFSNPDGEGITITVDRFDPGKQERGKHAGLPSLDGVGDMQIPCAVKKNSAKPVSSAEDYTTSIKLLHQNCTAGNKSEIYSFLSLRAYCSYYANKQSFIFPMDFDLILPSTKFKATPVNPVPIVPTALSKNLSGPMSMSEVQGIPKTGFLTIDQTRKLLLVLASDPKVNSLPIVGLWISGVANVHDPFVWASCIRYLFSSSLQERVCVPPEPFLIVLYSPLHSSPEYYDCVPSNGKNVLDFELCTCHEVFQLPKECLGRAESPIEVELTLVENGRKKDMLDAALENNKNILRARSKVNPLKSELSNSTEDIAPRSCPAPHLAKTPLIQPSVPDVSLLFDENTYKEIGPVAKPARPPPHSKAILNSKMPATSGWVQNGSEQPISQPLMNPPSAIPMHPRDLQYPHGYKPSQEATVGFRPITRPGPAPIYSEPTQWQPHANMQQGPLGVADYHKPFVQAGYQYQNRPQVAQLPRQQNGAGHTASLPNAGDAVWNPTTGQWQNKHAVSQVIQRPAFRPPPSSNVAYPQPTYQQRPDVRMSVPPMVHPTGPYSGPPQHYPQYPNYQPVVRTAGITKQRPIQQNVQIQNKPPTSQVNTNSNMQMVRMVNQGPSAVSKWTTDTGTVTLSQTNETTLSQSGTQSFPDSGLHTSNSTESNSVNNQPSYKEAEQEAHPDVYEVLKMQNAELKVLRDQLQVLLSQKAAPTSSDKQPDETSGMAQGKNVDIQVANDTAAVSTTTPKLETKKTCSIAINTSMWWPPGEPAKQVDTACQMSEPNTLAMTSSSSLSEPVHLTANIPGPVSRQTSTEKSDSLDNETLSLGEVQLTRMDKTDLSIMSDMIVDFPEYPSPSHEQSGNRSSSGYIDTDDSSKSLVLGDSVSVYQKHSGSQLESEEDTGLGDSKPDAGTPVQNHKQFYEHLMGSVQKMLAAKSTERFDQSSVHEVLSEEHQKQVYHGPGIEKEEYDEEVVGHPRHRDRVHQKQQKVDIAERTRQQLRKMGIDLESLNSDSTPRHDQSTFLFDPAFLPKVSYVSMMLDGDSDLSADANSLAMKYLKDDQLSELAKYHQNTPRSKRLTDSTALDRILSQKPGPADVTSFGLKNMSLATMKYMKTYGLLNDNEAEDTCEDITSDSFTDTSDSPPFMNVRQFLEKLAEKSMSEKSFDSTMENGVTDHSVRQECSVAMSSLCSHASSGNVQCARTCHSDGESFQMLNKSRSTPVGTQSVTSDTTPNRAGLQTPMRAHRGTRDEHLAKVCKQNRSTPSPQSAKTSKQSVRSNNCGDQAFTATPGNASKPVSNNDVDHTPKLANDEVSRVLDIERLKELPKLL